MRVLIRKIRNGYVIVEPNGSSYGGPMMMGPVDTFQEAIKKLYENYNDFHIKYCSHTDKSIDFEVEYNQG